MIDYRQVFATVIGNPRYLANLDWGEAQTPAIPRGRFGPTSPKSSRTWRRFVRSWPTRIIGN